MRGVKIVVILLIMIMIGVFALKYKEIFPPSKVCTPQWRCTEWSSCIGNIQQRSCSDLNNCRDIVNKPSETRPCQLQERKEVCGNAQCEPSESCTSCQEDCGPCQPSCIERWFCGVWSSCANNTKTRICTDANSCGTTRQKPKESASCIAPFLDTISPLIESFLLAERNNKIIITYSATDSTLPLRFTIIRSTRKTLIDQAQPGFFSIQKRGITIVHTATQPGAYLDTTSSTSTTYYYRMEVCDSASPPNCIATPTQKWQPLTSTITVTLGTPEKVWDYSSSSCDTTSPNKDLPDLQSRAIKNHLGELLLTRVNAPNNYLMFGQSFTVGSNPGDLQTICANGPALTSGNTNDPNSPPHTYDHQRWLASLYRDLTTNRIHALIHNEYHDPRPSSSPPCVQGDVFPSNQCNMFSITYAYSDDGGHHFTVPSSPPHIVAAHPLPWDPYANPTPGGGYDFPVYGYIAPSNIIKKMDSGVTYYYALFHAIHTPTPEFTTRGVCIMRTTNLNNPQSWRAWDGNGFTIQMRSPYDANGNIIYPNQEQCAFISKDSIDQLHGSLTYSTYLQKYLLVGMSNAYDQNSNHYTCGFFFSTSDDLIDWSPPQLLRQGNLPHPPCEGPTQYGAGTDIYPSLIDHAQLNDPSDPNFEKSGQDPFLYYVHWNSGPDRDLWRVPVHFDVP